MLNFSQHNAEEIMKGRSSAPNAALDKSTHWFEFWNSRAFSLPTVENGACDRFETMRTSGKQREAIEAVSIHYMGQEEGFVFKIFDFQDMALAVTHYLASERRIAKGWIL